MDDFGGGGGDTSIVPPGLFDGCRATEGSLEVIEVDNTTGDQETWAAFNVVGTFGFITAMFSIDEHPMWVYAVDGDYVTPQKVEGIVVANGDRYSVLVRLETAGDYRIRVAAVSAPQILSGEASSRTRRADSRSRAPLPPPSTPTSRPYIDDAGVNTTTDVTFFSQDDARPFPAVAVSPTADATFILHMRIDGASYRWALNDSLLRPTDYDTATPILFAPRPADAADNVTISTRNGTWVDLVFVAAVFPMPPHPLHKHGGKVFVLGAGTGNFTWDSVEQAARDVPESFNLVDPPRRDGFATPRPPWRRPPGWRCATTPRTRARGCSTATSRTISWAAWPSSSRTASTPGPRRLITTATFDPTAVSVSRWSCLACWLSVFLSVCLSGCVSFCLVSACLSICLPVCLSV